MPESAYRYRTWWTVHVGNSAQSRHGWISAGYRVSWVDLAKQVVTFARAADGDCPVTDISARRCAADVRSQKSCQLIMR